MVGAKLAHVSSAYHFLSLLAPTVLPVLLLVYAICNSLRRLQYAMFTVATSVDIDAARRR